MEDEDEENFSKLPYTTIIKEIDDGEFYNDEMPVYLIKTSVGIL